VYSRDFWVAGSLQFGFTETPFCYALAPMALFTKEPPATSRPQPRPGDSQLAYNGTFVGPNITIDGTLTGNEPVIVEGTIKGTINLNSDLRVGTKARLDAKVHAKNVIVEGKLTGDISADERVELVASATVEGNIKAPKIIVAEGARFRGNVDMGSHKPHVSSEPATRANKN
jgi:cytoskeletal protein CcmA (bactofilin family)